MINTFATSITSSRSWALPLSCSSRRTTAAVIARLKAISDDSLQQPGRHRTAPDDGLLSPDYVQQCPLMIIRDAAGTIQAFLNHIPSFDPAEANFDFLRHGNDSPGNINDFFADGIYCGARRQGVQRLNLGLCPLAGFDDKGENKGVIDTAIRFVYANGDRLYSFSGLRRFKGQVRARVERPFHRLPRVACAALRAP